MKPLHRKSRVSKPSLALLKRPLMLLVLLLLLTPLVGYAALNTSPGRVQAPTPEPSQAPLALADDAPVEVVDDEPPKMLAPKTPPKPPTPIDTAPHVGSRGPAILEIETKLSALKYMVGKVDGVFDRATQHGFIAFQKVEGLKRDGRGNPESLQRLNTASTPAPAYTTPPNHLEVNIAKQVVLVVQGGAVSHILPTSTGSNKNFTSEGWTRRAITPNGQFKITRKINALRISPLGELYKPSYFNGGIAFHGNGAVPTYPASHGCVRLPMQFADWFFSTVSPVGTVVYVHGGPSGPNPQPFIDDAPAPPPVASPPPEPAVDPTPQPALPGPLESLLPGPPPADEPEAGMDDDETD